MTGRPLSVLRQFVIGVAWIAGAAWVLIPHRFEGRVIYVISDEYGLGIHLTDPIGVIVPTAITLLCIIWPRPGATGR